MKITKIGTDFIQIDESNFIEYKSKELQKVHIIRLKFETPTTDKVQEVIDTFSKTNRFAIEDNIRIYNDILKKTNKKYYICNKKGMGLISFYKKNNKVLLDTTKLNDNEKFFVFNVALQDILNNTEVVIATINDYRKSSSIFNKWNGNLVVV